MHMFYVPIAQRIAVPLANRVKYFFILFWVLDIITWFNFGFVAFVYASLAHTLAGLLSFVLIGLIVKRKMAVVLMSM